MVSALLKTIIVITFVTGLLYSANLAFQGNLEMEVVVQDAARLKAYIQTFLK